MSPAACTPAAAVPCGGGQGGLRLLVLLHWTCAAVAALPLQRPVQPRYSRGGEEGGEESEKDMDPVLAPAAWRCLSSSPYPLEQRMSSGGAKETTAANMMRRDIQTSEGVRI